MLGNCCEAKEKASAKESTGINEVSSADWECEFGARSEEGLIGYEVRLFALCDACCCTLLHGRASDSGAGFR